MVGKAFACCRFVCRSLILPLKVELEGMVTSHLFPLQSHDSTRNRILRLPLGEGLCSRGHWLFRQLFFLLLFRMDMLRFPVFFHGSSVLRGDWPIERAFSFGRNSLSMRTPAVEAIGLLASCLYLSPCLFPFPVVHPPCSAFSVHAVSPRQSRMFRPVLSRLVWSPILSEGQYRGCGSPPFDG